MDLNAPATGAASAPAVAGDDRARFAIGGRLPSRVARPEQATEVAEALRDAARDGLAVVPWGGGIALTRAGAPERYDVALDLSAMRRITIHDADDFTITAECGLPLEELGAALAAKRQELPLEGAERWGATLGGVLAANASGARRRAFGAPRDRVLGARFVTGDGVIARTGGRVVKNVAGHAVHRLLVGSCGGLGVLLEASLKLLPEPPARTALVWGADAAMLADASRWGAFPRREPAALTVLGRALASRNPVLAADAPFTVVAGFEGDGAWVEASAAFARERLGASRVRVDGASAPPLWAMLADAEEMPGPRLTFTSPHVTPDAIAFLTEPAAGGDASLAERLVFHAACGRLHLWPDPARAAAIVSSLAARGFVLIESRSLPNPSRPAPAAVADLRRRVREALDPKRVFALGDAWERHGGH